MTMMMMKGEPSSPRALNDVTPLTRKSLRDILHDDHLDGSSIKRSSSSRCHGLPSPSPSPPPALSVDQILIEPSRRTNRQHPSLPKKRLFSCSPPHLAISTPSTPNNFTTQDVLRDPLLSAPARPPETLPNNSNYQHVLPSYSNETQTVSPTTNPLNHHALTPPSKPSPQDFYYTDNDLRTAFRLPASLPRHPKPISRRKHQSQIVPASFPVSSSARPPVADPVIQNFKNLSANYLTMLSNKSESTSPSSSPEVLAPVMPMDTIEAVLRAVGAPAPLGSPHSSMTSPAFSMMDDFMTSPFDTPLDDFLSTPLFEDAPSVAAHHDMMTSPLIDFYNTHDAFASDPNAPLFDVPGDFSMALGDVEKPSQALPLVNFPFDLTNFTTPPTPVHSTLPPPTSSIPPTPELSPPRELAPLPKRGRKAGNATGTRKGLTTQSLLPVEAPIQKRKYALPSATSRKEVPALFRKRQRALAAPYPDEASVSPDIGFASPTMGPSAVSFPAPSSSTASPEEEELAPLPPTASEKEQIEWKRKQNTLAARKSRKRKLEYQQDLEGTIKRTQEERDTWKRRAEGMRAMLAARGIEVDMEAWE